VASVLAAGGVRSGSRVAYLGLNSPLFFETLLAATHLGAIFVPVNYRLAPDEVAYVLGNAGCHSVVVEDGHRVLVDAIADSIPVRGFFLDGKADDGTVDERRRRLGENAADMAGAAEPVAVRAENIAMLMYTSGTTSRPKGVILTYRNLWWSQANVHAAIDIGPREATLAVAPLFHIGGLNTFPLGTLTSGGTVVIRRTFDPRGCLQDVARYRIASIFMVPVMFAALLRCEDFARTDLSSLRAAVVAGAPVPPSLVTEYAEHGVALQQAWGLTETAAFATYLPPHMVAAHPASAGCAMPWSEVRVVAPETGLPVEPGVRGELCVRGPNVTCGYWNNPEATAAAIDAEGWFHTGDLGYIDEQGLCYVVDRLKDLIISGGENVSPAEIERVLAEFPGVRDVAVVGVPDPHWGQTPVAVMCHSGGEAPPTIDAVRGFAAERLARFKLPSRVLHLETLPRNASGKIDRAAVRALAATAFGPAGDRSEATRGEKGIQ
jgi:fatty-acyl-CoA synthase